MPIPKDTTHGAPDDAALLALAATQHGLVTDEQAAELGLSDRALRRRLAAGVWDRPLPGVLRCAGSPRSGRQAAMAAALWAGPGTLISHATAGVLWQLDGVATTRVEVTVPEPLHPRHPGVVVHRTAKLLDIDRSPTDGIPVTSVLRTLIDLASTLALEHLELAVEDAMRRRLTTPGQLAWRVDEPDARRRRGSARLRTLLGERGRDRIADSSAEVLLQRLLVRHGLPRPHRQHPVEHAGQTIHVDLAYPEVRLAIEFDSIRWHTGRQRIERDAQRRNLLRAAGWQAVYVTHVTMHESPATVVKWISGAYADGESDEREIPDAQRPDSPARPACSNGTA